MTTSSDEIIAQRRVRSSELALEAARRRLSESYTEVAELRSRLATLEAELAERERQSGVEPDRLRAELAVHVRARRLAEQEAQAQQVRAEEAERLLAAGAKAGEAEGLERELGVAQRRVRDLETELEIIRRQTTEFEQVIRLDVDRAWRWLGEVADRVRGALEEVEALRSRAAAAARPAGAGAVRRRFQAPAPARSEPEPAGTAGASASAARAPASAAGASAEIASERFDEALGRLRSAAREGDEPVSATTD